MTKRSAAIAGFLILALLLAGNIGLSLTTANEQSTERHHSLLTSAAQSEELCTVNNNNATSNEEFVAKVTHGELQYHPQQLPCEQLVRERLRSPQSGHVDPTKNPLTYKVARELGQKP